MLDMSDIAGASKCMSELRKRAGWIAQTESTVLITGETGTGKGLLARSIHRNSSRCSGPFVHVDCTAFAASVIESELFGHERGSFTGAAERRRGRFELASSGTILLDEIGHLDPALQTKLLRVLEEREFERVGSNQTLPMRARVIAATNSDLRASLAAGSFRRDLYFRLAVFHLHIPPLRERLEDIPHLVKHRLNMLRIAGIEPIGDSNDPLWSRLRAYDWPGNVRELWNVVERLYVLGRDTELFDAQQVVGSHRQLGGCSPHVGKVNGRLGELSNERTLISDILIETGGNIARAARRLEMPRSTLRYWIKRYGLGDLIPRD